MLGATYEQRDLTSNRLYPIVLGLVSALIGFIIMMTRGAGFLVILAGVAIGVLLGILFGDRARRAPKE